MDRAIQTHGGNGFALEYGLSDMWWGARLTRTAPVSREMILNYVAEHSGCRRAIEPSALAVVSVPPAARPRAGIDAPLTRRSMPPMRALIARPSAAGGIELGEVEAPIPAPATPWWRCAPSRSTAARRYL